MWFLVTGVLLLVLKLSEVSPVVNLSWWWVFTPFGLAVLWWAWADSMGYTQKAEMDKLQERKESRRRKALTALGLDPNRRGRK
jgi:small Trp-rich protein